MRRVTFWAVSRPSAGRIIGAAAIGVGGLGLLGLIEATSKLADCAAAETVNASATATPRPRRVVPRFMRPFYGSGEAVSPRAHTPSKIAGKEAGCPAFRSPRAN